MSSGKDNVKEWKKDVFAVPGDRLGVIEEFSAGQGTYVEKGVIYA